MVGAPDRGYTGAQTRIAGADTISSLTLTESEKRLKAKLRLRPMRRKTVRTVVVSAAPDVEFRADVGYASRILGRVGLTVQDVRRLAK